MRPPTGPRKLSVSARDPASIMAVLEQGLTLVDDVSQSPGPEGHDLKGTAAAVSPSHEHVARKLNSGTPPSHAAAGRSESPEAVVADDAAHGVTLHPPAFAGMGPQEQDGAASTGGGRPGDIRQATLREQLAGAAKVSRERVRQIEAELTAAVRRSATVYTTKDQVLLKILREVDSGLGELGVRDVRNVCHTDLLLHCAPLASPLGLVSPLCYTDVPAL